MQKAVLKITFIIFANLLAFGCIGLILDALFKTEGVFLLSSIIISLPVFALIMYMKVGSILQELHTYNKNIDGK